MVVLAKEMIERKKWVSAIDQYATYRSELMKAWSLSSKGVLECDTTYYGCNNCIQPSNVITELYTIAQSAKLIYDELIIDLCKVHSIEVNL